MGFIYPKVNVIARLEFELAYFDSAVKRFNHYTTRIPPSKANGFNYRKWIHISSWPTDGTLTGTTSVGQSGSGRNGNEELLHVRKSSRTWASASDILVSYARHTLWGNLLLFRDAVGVFEAPADRAFMAEDLYTYMHTYIHSWKVIEV